MKVLTLLKFKMITMRIFHCLQKKLDYTAFAVYYLVIQHSRQQHLPVATHKHVDHV